MIIALLTDFGIRDEYVGVCKLVIKKINPSAEIVDISHEVYPFDIVTGSWMLYNIANYLPEGSIVLPIVDPGVGSERKGIVIKTTKDITFVGPDNGIMLPSARKLGISSIWEIKETSTSISPTFHARDIFAPVAAILSTGTPLELIGKQINEEELTNIDIHAKTIEKNRFLGEVMFIDQFGTIRTNIPFRWVKEAGIKTKKKATIVTNGGKFSIGWFSTFSEARRGELLVLSDSFGWLSVAKNAGRADQSLKLCPHDPITVLI